MHRSKSTQLMSEMGLGCVKTPGLLPHVEISKSNCICESQIILRTRYSMPCWRIVFSTFRECMSFYTARVRSGTSDDPRWERNARFASKATVCNQAANLSLSAISGLMHCSKEAVVGLCLLRFRPHESAALQALGGPDRINIVEFRNHLSAGWQRHPRLLGGHVNMDVRRTEIRVVHRADANETDGGSG